MPTIGSEYAAGQDLYAAFPQESDRVTIPAHKTVMIPTGIAIAIPHGYWGGVYARSGLATKQGLRPANCVGVIDSDYRGEVFVALHNDSEDPKLVRNGDRIAQLIIHKVELFEWEEVFELDETERNAGGFGSTGSN